jgi:hypothetical protein
LGASDPVVPPWATALLAVAVTTVRATAAVDAAMITLARLPVLPAAFPGRPGAAWTFLAMQNLP